MKCPKCGFENDPTYKFCMQCATPLQGQPATAQPYQSQPVAEKEKLLLPELILLAIAALATFVCAISGFIEMVRYPSFSTVNTQFVTGLTLIGLICCVVFLLIRKNSVKLAAYIISAMLVISFLSNLISSIVNIIKYSDYLSVSFYLGTIFGGIFALSLAVLLFLSILKQNSGLAVASIVVGAILCLFSLITFLVYSIGNASHIYAIGGASYITTIMLSLRSALIYASVVLLEIHSLKSMPKKQPAPLYVQQSAVQYQQPVQQNPQNWQNS